ncbi:hypothetical protein DDT52_04090 [Brenneria roseae subsp. roseae]|nr:hypothetical protein DDT52_04090 [Brenneria roseae subsp. roseae]
MTPEHARQGALNRRCSLTSGFWRKLCRYAASSAFATAVRAASDAFQTRHWLSPRPCGSPGGHAHLSTIFYAGKDKTSEIFW